MLEVHQYFEIVCVKELPQGEPSKKQLKVQCLQNILQENSSYFRKVKKSRTDAKDAA